MMKKIYEGREEGVYRQDNFCMLMEGRGAETVHRDAVAPESYGRTTIIWHLNGATVYYDKGQGLLNGEDVSNLVTVKVHGEPPVVSGIEFIVKARQKELPSKSI